MPPEPPLLGVAVATQALQLRPPLQPAVSTAVVPLPPLQTVASTAVVR